MSAHPSRRYARQMAVSATESGLRASARYAARTPVLPEAQRASQRDGEMTP